MTLLDKGDREGAFAAFRDAIMEPIGNIGSRVVLPGKSKILGIAPDQALSVTHRSFTDADGMIGYHRMTTLAEENITPKSGSSKTPSKPNPVCPPQTFVNLFGGHPPR